MKNTPVRLVRFALSLSLGLAIVVLVLWAAAAISSPVLAALPLVGRTYAPSATTVITHSGEITSNQTWAATATHVVSGIVTVRNNAVLTIEAGTLVKFTGASSMAFYRRLDVNIGTLVAVGTAAAPITFTSHASVPQVGDWGYLWINSGAATLSYVQISYGLNGVRISSGASRVSIISSTISHSSGDGVDATPGSSIALVLSNTVLLQNGASGVKFTLSNPYSPTLMNNQYLSNTGAAILMQYNNTYGWPLVTGSLPLTQAFRGNALDLGIAVHGSLKPVGNVIDWDEDPRFERVIWDALTVDTGYTLRVPPGGVIKFRSCGTGEILYRGGKLVVNGVLDAVGTPTQPITFTSLEDNTAGKPVGSGDVQTKRWDHVSIGGQAVMQHTVVRYGGGFVAQAIEVKGGGQLHLSDSQVYSSGSYGLNMLDGAQALFVTGTQFYSNTNGGVKLTGGASAQAYISASQVVSNNSFGVQVTPYNGVFKPVLHDVQLSYNTGPGLWVAYDRGWGLPFISGTTAITRNTAANDALALSGRLGPSGAQWTLQREPGWDYVVWANLTVAAGFTLTLPPDLLLKMRNVVGVEGVLLADAAGSQPITLTSYHDNSVGRPLGSGSPARGDWPGIQVSQNGRAVLSNMTLRYATNGLVVDSSGDVSLSDSRVMDNSSTGVKLVRGQLTVSNALLANNTYQGLLVTGGHARQASVKQSEVVASGTGIQGSGASFVLDVDSCTIHNNTGDGLYANLASGAAFTLSNNLVQQNGGAGLKIEPLCMGCMPVLSQNDYLTNTGPALLVSYPTQDNSGSDLPAITDLNASGNGLDHGVAIQGTLRNDAPISLQLDPTIGDIVVWNNSVGVDRNTTVTVQAGTVLKLKPSTFFGVKDNARVIFDGTASQPITVTSIDDNSVGQLNGDGVVLQTDQWAALNVYGSGARLLLRSTRVRYGAGNSDGMVEARGGGRVDIQSSQLSHGYRSGLYVSDYSFATLTDTQVFSNTYYSPFPSKGGIQINNSTLEMRGSAPVDFASLSSVYGNTQFGIYGSGAVTLTMDRTVVRNNGQHGMYVPASSGQLSIEGSAVLTNSGTGLYVRGIPTPTVHWTDFAGNAYGVNGDPATCVDALYNWWGDSLGPHDPLKSGCDTIRNYNLAGQWVNDYVSYRPWLTESMSTRGLSLSPERQVVLVPGATSVLTHTLLNTGNTEDTFVLTYTASPAPGWVTGFGPTLVSLLPRTQATIFVTLNVPAGVLSSTQDSVLITAHSFWGGEKVADTVTDTIWAGAAVAASLTPTSALSNAALPGQTVLYSFAITNQSNYTETYDPFGSTPHAWLISSTVGSAQVGIDHSASITFGVRVATGALSGTLEVASLSVRSIPADQVVANAFVTTTVLHQPGVDLYASDSKVIRLGQTYTYVHHLVNAGNYTDSYTLTASSTLSGTHWGFWPVSTTLASGAQATICLTMTMPSSAALADIYTSVLTATSWVSPALQAANTDQAKAGDYVSVTLSSAVATASPGEQHVFELDLFNAGNDFDTFTVTSDTPPWFVSYSPASAGLDMEVSASVYVTMQVPTQAISDTSSTVVVTATSGQSPTIYASATATLYAQRVVSFALDGSQAAFASPQTSVSFTHVLTSDSNYTDTFEVSGQSLYDWPVSGDSLTLGPYTSGAFTVTVGAPLDAISGTTDVVTFTANSQANPAVSHPVVDHVTATRLISLSLTPGGQYSVLPGDAFDVLHSLTNNGNYTEEFTLDVQEQLSGWIVDGPPPPVPLGPGQAGDVMFSVQPPPGSGGVTNTFTLTAASGANPLVEVQAFDQVVAINYPGVEIAPGESRQVVPGELLTFTHVLTNTGSGTDSFEIELSSASGWPVTFTPPSPIPIASGYTATLLISTSVPLTAPAAYTETLTVKAVSTTDPKVQDMDGDEMVVQFVAGLALVPGQTRTVDPGTLLSYTHVLTNLGNGTDTFAVKVASSRGWLTPEMQSTSITLTQGQTATLVVTLAVPAGSGGLEDTTVVTVTSQADAATWARVVNTTTVTHKPNVAVSPGQVGAGLPGETISYTHVVTNTGDGPDGFAVTATSSRGWQVDCAPAIPFALGVGEMALVTVSVTLPAGSGGLEDATVVTVTSQADPNVSFTVTDTSTVIQVAGVAMEPGQASLVAAGQAFSYTHVVTNTGNGPDGFVLAASSSQGWLSGYAPLGSFVVGVGETAVVAVTLTVPAGASGLLDTTMVTVTSQANSAVYACVSDTTMVMLEPGVALSPGQARQLDPGESVVYTHWVTNVGSGPDSFTVTVSSTRGWLTPGVQDTSVALAVNQAAAVMVTLTAPAGSGGLEDTTVVTVTSQADPATWARAVNTTSVVYMAGVALAPDYWEVLNAGQSLSYTHWLTNTGNGPDEFTLSLNSSRGWASLVESVGPHRLAAGDVLTVHVGVVAPPGSEGQQELSVLTATAGEGGVSAAVTDTTDVVCIDVSGVEFGFEPAEPSTGEAITFTASLASGSQPLYTWNFGDEGLPQVGNPILYAYTGNGNYTVILTVTNLCPSAASMSHTVSVVGSTITPTYRLLFWQSETQNTSPGTVVTYEHTLWNRGTVVDNYELHLSSSQGWAKLVGPTVVSLLPDESWTVRVRVAVPNGTGGLQDTTRVTATSQTRPATSFASVLDTTNVAYTPGLSLTPSYSSTLGPGAVMTYTHVLTNSGNGPDEFSLSLSSSRGWASLPDGTGPFDLAAGASRQIQVRVDAPLLVASVVDTTILTATAQTGLVSAAVTDTTRLECEGVSGVNLSYVPAEPATGQAITFTGHVLQGSSPFTYTWSLGDGMPAQEGNPILHSYATAGAYPVTVTVSNLCPSSGSASRVVTVTGNAVTPVYDVELGPDDSQTLDPGTAWVYVHTLTNRGNMADNYVLSLSSTRGWSSLLNSSHVSLQPGATALVRVRVVVPTGVEGGLSDTTSVTAVSQNDPTVQDSQADVTTVRLTGSASLSPDRSLTVQAGSQAVYTHTLVNNYNAAQSFTLTYTSSRGYTVTLEPSATASLAANGGTALVTVRVDVPGSALSGTVDSTRITAVGSVAGQAVVTDTTTITVAGTEPVAAFVPSSSSVVVGQVVSFTNNTAGTQPIRYAWTFGDGGASTLANPTHSYAAAGIYTVILTATNDYGWDTATATVTVTEHQIYLPLVLKNS